MLLAARMRKTGHRPTDEQIRDEVMTLFMAGHETTANLLTWTPYLLAASRNRCADGRGICPRRPRVRVARVVRESLQFVLASRLIKRVAATEDAGRRDGYCAQDDCFSVAAHVAPASRILPRSRRIRSRSLAKRRAFAVRLSSLRGRCSTLHRRRVCASRGRNRRACHRLTLRAGQGSQRGSHDRAIGDAPPGRTRPHARRRAGILSR